MMLKRLVLLAVMVVVCACASKKQLDREADELREAVEKNDFAAFGALFVGGKAPEGISAADVERLSTALASLGAFKDRSMKSISVKSDAPDKGAYELQYEKGVVKLEISVVDSKLVSFNFHGDDLKKALIESASKNFKLTFFAFVDGPKGKPIEGNILPPGPVHFVAVVQGLTRKDSSVHVRMKATLAQGEETLASKELLNQTLPVKPDSPPDTTLSGHFPMNKPGAYRLRLDILDAHGQRDVTHEVAFEVRAPKAESGTASP